MARKFKCRNGTILEERFTELGDEYTCIYDPTRYFGKGERVILLLSRPYNKGGALGVGYDIVEEMLPKKMKKPVFNTAVQDSCLVYFKGKLPTEPKEYRVLESDKDDPNMVKLPNGWQYYCPQEIRSMLMKALVDSMTDTDEIVLDVRGQGYTIDYDYDTYPMFRDIQGKPTLKRIVIKKV